MGGHIELDEDPVEAAVREIKEEVGLDVTMYDNRVIQSDKVNKMLINPIGMGRHRISETHEHIGLIYFAKSDSDEVIPEKRNDEWKWCSEVDLDTLDLQTNVREFAKLALRTLGS